VRTYLKLSSSDRRCGCGEGNPISRLLDPTHSSVDTKEDETAANGTRGRGEDLFFFLCLLLWKGVSLGLILVEQGL